MARRPMTAEEHVEFAKGLEAARDALLVAERKVFLAHRPRAGQKRAFARAMRAIQALRVSMDGQWLADVGDDQWRSPYLR